eukprot:529555-Alexandrium_andersonii.AAC.1
MVLTNQLCEAVLQEAAAAPPGPLLVVGDLNANPEDLPILNDALEARRLTNVGHVAELWGGSNDQATCLAPLASVGTVRDYVFANHVALQMVTGFGVDSRSPFLVHSPIAVRVDPRKKSGELYLAPKRP